MIEINFFSLFSLGGLHLHWEPKKAGRSDPARQAPDVVVRVRTIVEPVLYASYPGEPYDAIVKRISGPR